MGLPVYRNIGSQIFRDSIYLSCCMPKILISLLTKFPVFWFMVLDPSAHHDTGISVMINITDDQESFKMYVLRL